MFLVVDSDEVPDGQVVAVGMTPHAQAHRQPAPGDVGKGSQEEEGEDETPEVCVRVRARVCVAVCGCVYACMHVCTGLHIHITGCFV